MNREGRIAPTERQPRDVNPSVEARLARIEKQLEKLLEKLDKDKVLIPKSEK